MINYANAPLGYIMFNQAPDLTYKVNECLSYSDYQGAANLITDQFMIYFDNYNNLNYSDIKTIAYNYHINLDYRKYGNLSVIMQIIYEIQRKCFSNHFTLWKLEAPQDDINPFYILRVIVSNANIYGNGFCSYSFSGYGFDALVGDAYGMLNGTRAICTDSSINKIMLKPITFDYIPDNQKKPNNINYRDWYISMYGNSINNLMPDKMINTNPGIYNRPTRFK